jgi:hypothetical protein
MEDHPRRPGTSPPSDRNTNAADLRGEHGAIVPPDPPVAPALTDAEAGGATPAPMQKRAAPELGPRTDNLPPPAEARGMGMWGWILVALAVLLVVFLLFGRG